MDQPETGSMRSCTELNWPAGQGRAGCGGGEVKPTTQHNRQLAENQKEIFLE